MAVKKRKWTTSKGEVREKWVFDWWHNGTRHLKTFDRKKDADAFAAEVKMEKRAGVHVAPRKSPTVEEAGKLWIETAKANGLERGTVLQYEGHLKHILPEMGKTRLSELSPPVVRAFEDKLRKGGLSPAMTKKVLVSLGSILGEAHERGLVARNSVRDLRRKKRKASEKRQNGKLKVGVDIPSPGEITALIANAKPRWRRLLITAAFTGLQASELRGLRWSDVDLKKREIHVRQRADRFNEMGKPKSATSERTVPIGAVVANTLNEWKLQCPKGELDLVFPNMSGKVENLANITTRGLQPTGWKYGFHALRHFYASWCINSTKDGGLGLPPKVVQERLGHSTITLTMDRYGHLFPSGDDGKAQDAAELRLVPAS